MVVAVPTPDALWQVQMALVFQGLGNLSFAEDRCRRALDLEPSNWRALHILAQSVADNHAAIEILDSLIDRLEKDAAWIKVHQKSLAKMAWNLGNRHWQAEQFNNASEAYSKCIENDPTDSMTFLEILRGYHKRDQWNDIISLVKKLQSFGETHLAAVTVRLAESDDFHKIIHQVAMNRNELKILDVVYTDGIQYASQNQDYNAMIYLSYFQAKILSSLPNPPVDAVMEILEAALKIGLHLTTNPPHLLYMIGTLLGKIYYNKALLQTSSGHHESAIKFLEKISEIRCEQVPDEYLVFPPRMYLVRYYHLQGDDRMARQVARNTLQLALEILSDDDLSNDIWAFLKIGKITVAFLDKKNTATAFAMEALAGTALRKSQKPPEERPRENPDKAGREWECPRKCDSYGYRGENPGGLWACADCIEVNLSTDCRDKLLKGEFMKNVCDPSHNGFYIDEWDTERLKKVPLGYVPWGDQNITMEDWKNVLREKYLPNS
jgi:tetratricopeptide (TPR) repeat protein